MSENSADSSLTFRRAQDSDRDFIHAMHREAETWGDPNKTLSEFFDEDDQLYVQEWSEDRGGVIVEDNGNPIGAAWLRTFTKDRPGTGFISEEYPEIALAIAPGNTGKGLGRKLMTTTLEQAREDGRPGVSLCVAHGNKRALHLYERIGFEHHGESADHTDTFAVMLYTF